MRGLILAAGRGRRLGPSGDGRPKCLVELGGRTMLEWQQSALEQAGIGPLALVSGYRGDQIPGEGWTRFNNPHWAETGVVASLLCARAWLEDSPCVVSYADVVYEAATIAALRDTPGDLAVVSFQHWQSLWSARFADVLTDAETFDFDRDNQLTDIGRRPESVGEIRGQFMGLVKTTPQGFHAIARYLDQIGAESKRIDMTGLLRGLIESGTRVRTRTVPGFWFEVDSAADLALFPEWRARWKPLEQVAPPAPGNPASAL